MGHLTLTLRINGEAPYVDKEKKKFKARFNNYKSAHRSYRKKRKVPQKRFTNSMCNTVITGLIISILHQLNNVKYMSCLKKRKETF